MTLWRRDQYSVYAERVILLCTKHSNTDIYCGVISFLAFLNYAWNILRKWCIYLRGGGGGGGLFYQHDLYASGGNYIP